MISEEKVATIREGSASTPVKLTGSMIKSCKEFERTYALRERIKFFSIYKSPSDEKYKREFQRVYRAYLRYKLDLHNKDYDEKVFTESDVNMDPTEGAVTTVSTKENVKDTGGLDHSLEDIGSSRYINNGQNAVCDIDTFLERPIQIDELSISTGALSLEYKVWDLISKDPALRAKFRNFAYFHGDMEITIAVSGTPFHMGKILVSYQPLTAINKTLNVLKQRLTVDPNVYRPMFLNYLSQAKSSRVIDVKYNEPLKIHVPFISPKPMWRLFNSTAPPLAATTSYNDFEDSGSVFIYTINNIDSVSSTPSDVGLTIYARLKNVKLGTLTASGTTVATESGKEDPTDETKTGPVTAVTSALTDVAVGLSAAVPEIAPFTIPSAIVLKGINEISSYFGWSRPIMKENRVTMKPDGFNNGMVTIANDTAKVMGIDPQRQMTVDPRMFGTNKDELVLEYIANRKTYINTFVWAVDSVPFSPLQYYLVWPNYATFVEPLVDNFYVQPSSLSFASAPFTYWRGDIVFTIEVVASMYHRGKIAISYDPDVFSAGTLSGVPVLNKEYTFILDLQETTTVSLCVNWANFRAFCAVRPVSPLLKGYGTGTANFDTTFNMANGYIWIYPLTYLQSPDSTVPVSINMYVHGENMHYAVPTSANINSDRTVYTEADRSFDPTCVELNPSQASTENIHLVHFGEKVTSFRQLLKRYTLADSQTGTGSVLNFVNSTVPIYPKINPKYGSSATITNILSYLRYSYIGMKGSYRHRIKFGSADDNSNMKHINVNLQPRGLYVIDSMVTTSTNTYAGIDLNGGLTFVPSVNSAVEFDAPCYTNNLWLCAQQDDWSYPAGDGATFDDLMHRYVLVQYDQSEPSPTADNWLVVDECSGGEDFNLYYYTGASPYRL